MDKVVALHRDLKGEWEKQSPNLRKCDSLLADLKVNIFNLKNCRQTMEHHRTNYFRNS